MKKLFLITLCATLFAGGPGDLPNDIRWVRESNEYDALCIQTYANAWDELKDDMRSEQKPWGLVLDLDETVMDNSLYQVELFERGEQFSPESWDVWVTRAEAGLLPGFKTFLDSVRTIPKARLVFISNRMANRTDDTIINLKKLHAFDPSDIFLLRANREDRKPVRRNEVLSGIGRMIKHGSFKVLGYFGDAMGDFPDDENYQWGVNKFMLPNPMYGKW